MKSVSTSTLRQVCLGGFSLEVLNAAAPADDWDIAQTVERALRRYLGDRELRPPGWVCLPLPERNDEESSRPAVDVPLDEAMAVEVGAEAGAQKVSAEALVTHAVMYAWAAEHPQAAKAQRDCQRGGPAQGARGGKTTGVAPILARDPRRL